ncbi:hypothetical protein [Noviherbaspirillum saxi]|nr:hypothetical protein [Noviherbaspirillum saxi]
MLTCPHCGFVIQGDGNSIFLAHALSLQEEAEFEEEQARIQPDVGDVNKR